MDLSRWLRRRATPRPFLVSVPGGTAVRLAAEREVRQRGWTPALSPAEADLLVVCGVPGADLRDAVETVWATLPAPRARVDLRDPDVVGSELVRGRALLDDAPMHERNLPEPVALDAEPAGDHDADEMAGRDMSGHEMAGHEMHMGVVAGLPMAQRAPDRDGLALDQLHVSLGPVLSDWPAGLVVRLTLQGDVVQSAEVEVLGLAGASPRERIGSTRAAALDSLGRLLSVCGWATAACTARRLRDEVLAGAVDEAGLQRFTRRVRRSASLQWATDGIGRLDGPPTVLAADATARLRRLLDEAERPGTLAGPELARRARAAVEVLPRVVEGHELAGVRVAVASLDPDPDLLVHAPAPVESR